MSILDELSYKFEKLGFKKYIKYIYFDSDNKIHFDNDGKLYDEAIEYIKKHPIMCVCGNIIKNNNKDMVSCCLHGGKDTPLVLEFKCKKCGNVCLKYCYHNADGTLKQTEEEIFKVW